MPLKRKGNKGLVGGGAKKVDRRMTLSSTLAQLEGSFVPLMSRSVDSAYTITPQAPFLTAGIC